MTEYQLFAYPMPILDKPPNWRAEPSVWIVALGALAVAIPLIGWPILALLFWILDWFVDVNWGATMHVIWIGLLLLGVVVVAALAALIVYLCTATPTHRIRLRAEHEHALAAWHHARAEHISHWARRNGWN